MKPRPTITGVLFVLVWLTFLGAMLWDAFMRAVEIDP